MGVSAAVIRLVLGKKKTLEVHVVIFFHEKYLEDWTESENCHEPKNVIKLKTPIAKSPVFLEIFFQ